MLYPNIGISDVEAYDMETVTPIPEWEAMYVEVKEELRNMGICF